jgi:tetratricopeptide (TPR) repeat protein
MEKYRLYFGYGLKLPWNTSAGLAIKVERSAFLNTVRYGDDIGVGVGLDLGLMYRPELSSSPYLRDWSLGVNIQNLFSPQIKEGRQADILPLTFRFGLMRTIRFIGGGSGINILMDLDMSPDTDLGVSFGSEYNYRDIGKIRVGYSNSGIALGAGLQYSMFQVDYAYGNPSTDGLLDPIHRISLSVNFGMNRDEMFEIVEELRLIEEERIITEIREADKQKFIAEHLQKADEYFQEKSYLDAIVEYQQVIGADPFHQQAKIMLDSSNVLLDQELQNRQSEAITAALDKDRAEAVRKTIEEHYDRGRLYLDKKQYTEALIQFNLALERDPNNETVRSAIRTTNRRLREDINSLVRRARQDFQKQNYSEALRLLSEARLLSGDDPQVKKEVDTLVQRVKLGENIQKGILLYDIGQYEDALSIFETMLEEDPSNPLIQQYYTKSKIDAMAEKERMDPETERRYLEGVDKFLLGKYQEAIQVWEEIRKDHPYNKKVLEAISGAKERLERLQSD